MNLKFRWPRFFLSLSHRLIGFFRFSVKRYLKKSIKRGNRLKVYLGLFSSFFLSILPSFLLEDRLEGECDGGKGIGKREKGPERKKTYPDVAKKDGKDGLPSCRVSRRLLLHLFHLVDGSNI